MKFEEEILKLQEQVAGLDADKNALEYRVAELEAHPAVSIPPLQPPPIVPAAPVAPAQEATDGVSV